MTSISIIGRFTRLSHRVRALLGRHRISVRPDLHHLACHPDQLPGFVRDSAVALHFLQLLGPLAWHRFPERDLETQWGIPTVPYAPFVAACLVKLDQQLRYMSNLRQYLVQHPALFWLLGFPLVPSRRYPWGFDADASLPSQRHLTRLLRRIPNATLQVLLDDTVHLIQAELETEVHNFGQAIALDTKHILAWVKENNPKDYLDGQRYDKNQQPNGDPDCRLGCKRRRNQRASSKEPPPTPADNPRSPTGIPVAEFYWGYASGVVATKVPGWGEFVLAELTQPFDRSDVSYFHPLMEDTERRLGTRPMYGAFDAAFDAFYVYEYFHHAGGFAAVPFSQRGGHTKSFDADGRPLCQAGLSMPLRHTFRSRTTLVHHQRGRHVCPLLWPEDTGDVCPIQHKQWDKGGCTTTLPTSIGARIRYQLDRDSDAYKQIYKQRTAIERINSQAKERGIERPRLRNGQAVANQNTLIYVLINLHALQRIRAEKTQR
jgi:hypothetical protein